MWIPQSIWLAGYLMFALVAGWAAFDALRLFLARRVQELNARFGPQTLEEEIEAETDIHLKTPPAAAPATTVPNPVGATS